MTTEIWALVPVEATLEIIDAAAKFAHDKDLPAKKFYAGLHAAMIQASPGTALLAEVLAARDALNSEIRDGEMIGDYINRKSAERTALLAALDKLGPAQSSEGTKP